MKVRKEMGLMPDQKKFVRVIAVILALLILVSVVIVALNVIASGAL